MATDASFLGSSSANTRCRPSSPNDSSSSSRAASVAYPFPCACGARIQPISAVRSSTLASESYIVPANAPRSSRIAGWM